MIQDKCYNIHQDLRSVRENLNEGLSRFPDCKKLNKFRKKFEEDFSKNDLARKDDKDKNDLLHSDNQINQMEEKQKNGNEESSSQMVKEYVHHSLNEDDKVGDSSPAMGVCSVIEGDEVKFTEIKDDINKKVGIEKQQIGNKESSSKMDQDSVNTKLNEDDRVVDSSHATGVDSVIEEDVDKNEKVEKEKLNLEGKDDDGKQDVVMDEIDEQNKEEDACSPKKVGMDNENQDAEAVELSSSIKRCGHPTKHSYHVNVKDVNEPIAEKINNEDRDAEETPFEFADRKDEQIVHNANTSKNANEKCTTKENTNVEQAETQVETTKIINECHIDVGCSKNEKDTNTGNQTVEHNDADEDTANTDSAFDDIRDGKSEKEDEESDALAITLCNVCHHVLLRVLLPNENLNDFLEIINIEDSDSEKEENDFGGETDNEEKYDPKKDADYKGEFYKSPYELKPIEPKIRVSASEKLVPDTLFAMMYKPREIVFKTYEGFMVLAIEMETLAKGLDVHYEVINAWSDVLNTIEKDRKDDDKTARKYCFKTRFLEMNCNAVGHEL
ncbi:hypothetical protein Tco_1375706 [Tanacetum coccineum]